MVLRNDNSPSSTPLGVTATAPLGVTATAPLGVTATTPIGVTSSCHASTKLGMTECSAQSHAERSRGVILGTSARQFERSRVLTFLFVLLSFFSFAQTFPVTINTFLAPNFSGYLLDYASPTSNDMQVMIQFNDFTVSEYRVWLKFEIVNEDAGVFMVTKSSYKNPIILTPGSPTILTGLDLKDYFDNSTLDISGNASLNKSLPEGSYKIKVTAYDDRFQPGKQVSNNAMTFFYFQKYTEPMLISPSCSSVVNRDNQSIVFNWMPSNNPNAVYVIKLFEMQNGVTDPTAIANSADPIFEDSTTMTTYFFGPDHIAKLSEYKTYVWRIQAKDHDSRDIFNLNGYSQACTFKNGDMAEEIGNSIHLELTGQAVSHRLAKCSWESNNLLDSFLLQVRKEGTENWFDFRTTANYEKIPNLEPSTTYEARLQGKSSVNGFTTEWSNTVAFTTLAPPNYTCNDQNAPTDALQSQPLAAIKAKPGLIIQSGQFEVFATSITSNGTPGWYKGSGYALVFGALPLAVKWDNIYIDDNNRQTDGQIDALSKGIESFVHQYDVRQGEENAIYVPDGTLDSVYAANGQVCYSLSGSDSSVCADYPPNTNVVVVRDGEGNQYVVTIYPEPATVEGPFNYIAYSGDSLSSSSNRQVTFAASATQNYGFDAREVSAWTENYEAIKMKDGENYFVPFKSVGENQTDEVTANIQIEGYDATFLSFKTKSGAVLAHTAAGSNKFKLSVPANAVAVYAWYGTEKLGKLNVKSMKALTRKVVIVPVNNTAYSTTNVVDSLNKIYKQANVSWTATTAQSFTFDLGTDGLEAADATLFSKYSTEMRALRDAYIAHDSTYDKNAYYLFVVPKFTDASQVGYMVRGKGLGFITPSAKIRDIAHELGHGAFGLEHTFPNPPQGSTANLMDYSQGSQLTQKQWDKIHSPMPVISWLDGEEDGSAIDPSKISDELVSNGIILNAESEFICITPSGELITISNSVSGLSFGTKYGDIIPYGSLTGFKNSNGTYNAIYNLENTIFYGYAKVFNSNATGADKYKNNIGQIEYYRESITVNNKNPNAKVYLGVRHNCEIQIKSVLLSSILKRPSLNNTGKGNGEIKGLYEITQQFPNAVDLLVVNDYYACDLEPLDLTRSEIFQCAAGYMFNPWGKGGLLIKLVNGKDVVYLYSDINKEGNEYFLQWDEYKKSWEDYTPNAPEKFDIIQAIMDVNLVLIKDPHFMLDAIGSTEIPFVSWSADALNGALYLYEGDKFNASLSFASIVVPNLIVKSIVYYRKVNTARKLIKLNSDLANTFIPIVRRINDANIAKFNDKASEIGEFIAEHSDDYLSVNKLSNSIANTETFVKVFDKIQTIPAIKQKAFLADLNMPALSILPQGSHLAENISKIDDEIVGAWAFLSDLPQTRVDFDNLTNLKDVIKNNKYQSQFESLDQFKTALNNSDNPGKLIGDLVQGAGNFAKYTKVDGWLKGITNATSRANLENIIKNWSDDLLTKLDNVPSRNPNFLSQVEANPSILNHFEDGASVISSKGSGLKPLELDMYALDKARPIDKAIITPGTNSYKINTTRKSFDNMPNSSQMDINPQSGKIRDANGNVMVTDNVNGEGLMYAIDDAGNIWIGGRGGEISYPHPTLIGGVNPNVKCAGMIKFKDGRILEISNNSGHFKPTNSVLQEAETIFKQKLPANSFDSQFKVVGF